MRPFRGVSLVALGLAALLALAGCETRGGSSSGASSGSASSAGTSPSQASRRSEVPLPEHERAHPDDPYTRKGPGLLGTDGINIGGALQRNEPGGIGVSVYLWRASLDSLSHLPLRSADPFGGLIQTEWYEPPETPGERLRVDLRILSEVLDANGVSASVFRQSREEDGTWRDTGAAEETALRLEEIILRRAREIRFAEAP